jgi:hypothetical protein
VVEASGAAQIGLMPAAVGAATLPVIWGDGVVACAVFARPPAIGAVTIKPIEMPMTAPFRGRTN